MGPQLIGSLASPDKFFRPFGGGGHLDRRLLSHAACDYLTREQFTCVLWNVVPRDWDDPDAWVERAFQACLVEPESLIVLHDHVPVAMSKLDRFIGYLKDAGHSIVQEFPASCVPIVRGAVVRDLTHLLSDP